MFKNKDYVLTILKEGGFSKAAESMYVSQPSLSATIKRIEEKVKAPIFDRSTTPVSLTEIGAEYVRHAMEIESIEKNFGIFLEDNFNLTNGKIRIGGSSFFCAYVLPHMIFEFNNNYPKVTIELFEDNTRNLINKVQEGKIDIVIDNSTEKFDNISIIKCMDEILLLAVPSSFEINNKLASFRLDEDDIRMNKHLNKKYSVHLREFEKEPFILLTSENDTGKRADFLFAKYGISPNIIFNVEQQLTAYNISSNQLGISFISDSLAKNRRVKKNLFYYRLEDIEVLRNVNFYVHNKRYISNACKRFIEFNTN